MANIDISIMLKPALLDAQGRVVQSALRALGYDDISSVRIGKKIQIQLPDAPDLEAKVVDMCGKLLANPVIEDYTFKITPSPDLL